MAKRLFASDCTGWETRFYQPAAPFVMTGFPFRIQQRRQSARISAYEKEIIHARLFIHIDRFCAHETAFLICDLKPFLFLHFA